MAELDELPDVDAWAAHTGRGDAPPGYHFEWTREDESLLASLVLLDPGEEPKRCRWSMADRRACGAPSVAKIDRASTRWTGEEHRPRWWHYCRDHLFGRVLVDGVLYYLALRPDRKEP